MTFVLIFSLKLNTYSRLSRLSTAWVSGTGLMTVGPAKVKACKYLHCKYPWSLNEEHLVDEVYWKKLNFTKNWWKKPKNEKMEQKKYKIEVPLRKSTSVWVSTSFKEKLKTLFLRCFFLVFDEKSPKNIWNQHKRLQTAQKSILTSIRLHAAQENWSKYTTALLVYNKIWCIS